MEVSCSFSGPPGGWKRIAFIVLGVDMIGTMEME